MPIYRFNFSKQFMEELAQFSKLHQYTDRKSFKDHWDKWICDNTESIQVEMRVLTAAGYNGDIYDKMYKSARYYFKNKTETVEPKIRRKYVPVTGEFISSIDTYINGVAQCSPADAFERYCMMYSDTIASEINKLMDQGMQTNDISAKIKKTFKNRYFRLKNMC